MSLNTGKKYRDLLLPTSDFVFCLLFGSNQKKHRLISLLNSILDGKPHIKDVYIDPTEYKKTQINGKTIRLDINATTDDGTKINVEMQCVHFKNIIQRAEYYQSMMMRDTSIRSGESYGDIQDRISIWITDKVATNRKGCMHEAVLMFKGNNVDNIEIASESHRLFIVELPKVVPEQKQFITEMFPKWMQFIKDPIHMPDPYLAEKEIQDALEELEYLSHDDETRSDYNYRMREICDMNAIKTDGFRDGKEEGLREGKEEGLREGKIEAAKRMLHKGFCIDDIVECSGLSENEVKTIIQGTQNSTH